MCNAAKFDLFYMNPDLIHAVYYQASLGRRWRFQGGQHFWGSRCFPCFLTALLGCPNPKRRESSCPRSAQRESKRGNWNSAWMQNGHKGPLWCSVAAVMWLSQDLVLILSTSVSPKTGRGYTVCIASRSSVVYRRMKCRQDLHCCANAWKIMRIERKWKKHKETLHGLVFVAAKDVPLLFPVSRHPCQTSWWTHWFPQPSRQAMTDRNQPVARILWQVEMLHTSNQDI